MRYQVLTLNIHYDLHYALKHRLQGMDSDFTMALTYQDAIRLCAGQPFHLIVLCFSEATPCVEFLVALRRISYAPAIVLFNHYDIKNACSALQSGADLCIGSEWPVDLVADHIMAQFRRYSAYTHDKGIQDRKSVV